MATPPSMVSGIFCAGVTPFYSRNAIFLSSNSSGVPGNEPCPKKDGRTESKPRSRSSPERRLKFAKNLSFIGPAMSNYRQTGELGTVYCAKILEIRQIRLRNGAPFARGFVYLLTPTLRFSD